MADAPPTTRRPLPERLGDLRILVASLAPMAETRQERSNHASWLATLDDAQAEIARLRETMRRAMTNIDQAMGDTDPLDPDHPLLLAHQRLAEALHGQ